MPKKTVVKFKISAALKDIIGRDLITDDNIAVFELVKNSYDARATKVEIQFFDIYGDNPTIVIQDNGKGMDAKDLKNKWLFVAYSAKKEGTEDKDYRSKIYQDKPFAGAKGIGRFSCDRLGKCLTLETIKNVSNAQKQVLEIDWTKFERKLTDQFIKIPSTLYFKKPDKNESHGTRLIISKLRENWDSDKLLALKKSLAKLVNPNDQFAGKKFKIIINCPEEIDNDQTAQESDRINGEVKNFIFKELGLRTTRIEANISKDGKSFTTTLIDGGTLIYRIVEKNRFPLLRSINFTLYYLNRSAKLAFAKLMGLASRLYGHVFLYKNGFRIYPFGEPYEDPLKIDVRKSRKKYSTLGTGELIGQIEIYGDNSELKETSSRGNGLIKTHTYSQLEDAFWVVLERLEKYVVDVQKWGLSIEDNLSDKDEKELKANLLALISNLTDLSGITDIEYGESFLESLNTTQEETAIALINNLQRIASNSGNQKILKYANKAEKKVKEIRKALSETQKKVEETEKELEEQVSENLFLKSIKSQDIDEVVSFLHHIGLSAANIDIMLKGLYGKINRKEKISNDEIRQIIEDVSFENTKVLSISKFATKANFKLFTEEAEIDIITYIKEYINNVVSPVNKKISFKVSNFSNINSFIKKIRPIELNILFDNLISNSIKSIANNVFIEIDKSSDNNSLQIRFRDDGEGVKKNIQNKIFDLGFTTTTGSGIGLFHTKKIMKGLNGNLKLNLNIRKGAEFIIDILK